MIIGNNAEELVRLGGGILGSSSLGATRVRVRPIPYPYQAMLSICSDLDETPDCKVYFEIMRYLNTSEETAMGRGAGLEIGNTIYFDMPPDQFAYWNTDESGRAMVRELIRSGHIDCLHSFGDLATTRSHAQRALEELDHHDCHLKVWVDHGTAPTNFDGDIMKGSGDVPNSPAYHADLTLGFGIEYVWRGRVTSIIGQNVSKNFSGLWTTSHPFSSGKTIFKEFAKGLLGRFGNEKYSMHLPNRILKKSKLRDSHEIYEFLRCNPYWGGVSLSATALGISDILVEKMLESLVKRQGFCVLYTHLGKIGNNHKIFNDKTKEAFSLLARFMSQGKILVTTTRRLLDYCRIKDEISCSTKLKEDTFHIYLSYTKRIDDLDGITMYIPRSNVKVWLNQKEVFNFRRNPPDQTGQESISFPWNKMEFPQEIF